MAGQLGRSVGRLLMIVKSAHVYQTEEAYVRGILASWPGPPAADPVSP